jgi:sugar fermentation stimulation protein A
MADPCAWIFDPPLVPGRLVQRENRFIAEVELEDGRRVKAHSTNTGSLMGVTSPGRRVYLRPEPQGPGLPPRRTAYTWVLVRHGHNWVGVDTMLPNRLGFQAARARALPGLEGYSEVLREVPYGAGSRVDLLLRDPGPGSLPDCYVEIKNCHLTASTLDPGIAGPRVPARRGGRLVRDIALFPDAPTERGRKHLRELAKVASRGHRAMLLVVVQRSDVDAFAPAAGIDPEYASLLAEVVSQGVEVQAWACNVSPQKLRLARPLRVLF